MRKENFEKKFTKAAPDKCWLWVGAKTKPSNGYGQITLTKHLKRTTQTAHSYSYQTYIGPIPEGKIILHSCDVRLCVNPRHLWPGTYMENREDMLKKKRENHPHSERASKTKLTKEQVVYIRQNYKPYDKEWSCTALAKKFGLHRTSIWFIIKKINWKYLSDQ